LGGYMAIDKFINISEEEIKVAKKFIKKHGEKIGFHKADHKFKYPEGTMQMYFEKLGIDATAKGTHLKIINIIDEYNAKPGDMN